MSSENLQHVLTAAIRGDVSFDLTTRGMHSTDASQYQITPACVVWPRDRDDAVAAVRLAGEHRLAITARGAGTSLSGQTMWSGMVLDTSRYMDQVLEINAQERWARVQPGVIRDHLNTVAAAHHLHFAPDPATGNRATVGGMIGNNSSGTHSIVFGKTSDHVIEATVALADGTVLTLGPKDVAAWQAVEAASDRAAEIHRGFRQVIEANREEIAARFPKVMRRVSGYNLDAYLPDIHEQPWNLATLIAGSEGTLGVLIEAKVRLTPNPVATALCIVHFDDLFDSLRAVPRILEHQPAAVELIDDRIAEEAKRNRSAAQYTNFIVGKPKAMLITEFFGDSPKEAADKAYRLAATLEQDGVGYARPVQHDVAEQDAVWQVRKLGLGLLSNVKGPRKRQPFVEDACVPVEVLPEYVRKVQATCDKLDVPMALYGHASVGVLHINPMLDLHQADQVAKMKMISEQVFELVQHYGGSWSGEHGDGIVRGGMLKQFFGDRIYQAFIDTKKFFDPVGLMNPGKIIDVPPMTENLRYGQSYHLAEIKTQYHYRDQGGFALAVEQCNGVGACRKIGSGTMCPSYMATRDEEHSTRGRANALRLAMTGQLGQDSLASDRLKSVLDLCLACKACKSECPNSVDMARLKSETLQMHHDAHGTPFGTLMISESPRMASHIAGPLAPVANWMQRRGLFKWAMHKIAGIDARRTLPAYANQSFAGWFFRRKNIHRSTRQVVLFSDSFTNYYQPEVGKAAVELLEGCGYEVLLAQAGCCQRTRLSKGMVRLAKRDGTITMRKLDKFAQKGLPILALEPSCASALSDDLPDLIEDAEVGRRVSDRVKTIDGFLAEELDAGRLHAKLTSPYKDVLVHGHCHQKSLFAGVGGDSVHRVLSHVEGLTVLDTGAGCCGMAGSFGYEHYDVSMKIAEDRLVPALKNHSQRPDSTIVASGFSCRHQIADLGAPAPKHWVQIVHAQQADA